MGMWTNQSKTKHMPRGKAYRLSVPSVVNISNNCFDRVESITYLGTLVMWDNNVYKEIGARLGLLWSLESF